jgi:hypothetical protein
VIQPAERNDSGNERDSVYDDKEKIHAALVEGVRDARRWHKRMGLPVVEWRDGKVVWIQAEEIDDVEPTDTNVMLPAVARNE